MKYLNSEERDTHVMWVPCHHDNVCPQVADGGEGLQIWRVTANILNKQSQTADTGWSSSLGLGTEQTTPYCKESNKVKAQLSLCFFLLSTMP